MPVRRTRSAPDMDDYMEKPADDDPDLDVDDPDDDDPDDDAPAPVKKGRSRPRGHFDDADEDSDEEPKQNQVVQRGYDVAKKRLRESKTYTDDFRWDEAAQVVKFLDPEPYVYSAHWLSQKTKGKKNFVCLGKDCPLCQKLGDRPSDKYAWTIVNLSAEDSPVQLLTVGSRLANQLFAHDASTQGPLPRQFWSLSRSGRKQQSSFSVVPVKARDLAEDWDLDPDDVEKIVKSSKIPENPVYVSSKEDLKQVVNELLYGEEDD